MQQLVGVVPPAGGFGKRFAVLDVESDRLVDDLTQFRKHFPLVVAVAAGVEQPGTAPDETLIFFRPLDDLYV